MKKTTITSHFTCFMLFFLLVVSGQAEATRESISFQHIGTQDGLPQSTINVIYQDSLGYMWFGTYDGLSRFDGYQFINFKNDPSDPRSLSNNIVVAMLEDKQGFLWVGTAQNGVNRFDPKSGNFERFLFKNGDPNGLSHSKVNAIHQDPKGRIWIATDRGLNLFLPEKQTFAHFYNNPLDLKSLPAGSIVDLADDGKGNLWVASSQMLSHFNIEQQTFTYFDKVKMPAQINRLFLDIDESLWIGTRFDGLYHLKKGNRQFEHFTHDGSNANSLSFNDVRDVLRASNGDLWVATEEGGLNVRRKGDTRFQSFKRNSADPHSISINDVWSLYQDQSGLLWIGTAGGGLNTTQSFDNQFSRLTHSPHQANSLSHEFVWDIEQDSHEVIWFGTLKGFDKYYPKEDRLEHLNNFVTQQGKKVSSRIQSFVFDDQGDLWFGNQQGQLAIYSSKNKLTKLINRPRFPRGYVSYNRIRMVDKDQFGNIWVGTDDGLLQIDSKTHKITTDFHYSKENLLGDSTIRTMLDDQHGNIWFGSWDQGLQKYDPEFGTVTRYKNELGNPRSLSNNTIRSLHLDYKGNLWIGTFNGLNKLSAQAIASNRISFSHYLEKDGLPNSAIYGIAGDGNGKIWLSSNNGLSQFDPEKKTFKNYSVEDGLPANEFNGNAVLRYSDNTIYFGSVAGVAIVSANSIKTETFQPNITVTSLSLSGERLKPLGVALEEKKLEFTYNKNDLIFEFASLDFRHVKRNKFRYRLLPYNQEWTTINFPNQAAFTNLDPKDYSFELQATNSNGVWSKNTLNVNFSILPPLWSTWWAYSIYLLVFFLLITHFISRHKKTLQEQREINRHLRRVDQLKDEFLANTSHELRTPLNGIIGIAESLQNGSAGLQNQKTLNHLKLIVDGGKRLSQLVNDILDYKKLTHDTLTLRRRAVDIQTILEVVISLLKPLIERKPIKLINRVEKDLPLVFADEDRVQQIFHNLIGNAIKYTDKGRIEVSAKLNVNELEICVSDTGIGIDETKIEAIFKPFEQLDLATNEVQKGTGLGLSVTRQLIEQHEGEIWVKAKLAEGSQFYFTLPCWLENHHLEEKGASKKMIVLPKSRKTKKQKTASQGSTITAIASKGKILIADDDPINLQVLSDLLQMNNYQVVCAKDGVEASKFGLSEQFDLAILDVMMPGMSGYEVTKNLRSKFNEIELPILLLSARNQPGDVTAGFDSGANDYVTKPIVREVLLSRIETMILLGGLVEAKRQRQHAKTLRQAYDRLGKYFPKQMVNQIITNSDDNQLVAERKLITVLFADLAGFTSISDRFEPEAITDMLNSFLSKMGHLVEQHDGVLNEILGDGLVVLFGALDSMSKLTQAKNAANLSLTMQRAMSELAAQWLDAGFDHNVKLRVGIHQDFATVGNFGSKDLVAFRAVGSGVNFASRLEGFSQSGEITVSYSVYAQCRSEYEFSELEEVQFAGFNHKHRVCKLRDWKN